MIQIRVRKIAPFGYFIEAYSEKEGKWFNMKSLGMITEAAAKDQLEKFVSNNGMQYIPYRVSK